MFKNNKKLVLASIFIALTIIFSRLLSFQLGNFLRIGFGDLPIMLAGIILGPIWGMAVGAISDILGFFIAPLGDFFIPGITLSAALWGLIPAIIVRHIFKKRSFVAILTTSITCAILIDIISTPFWLSLAYGSLTYFTMLPVQTINATAMVAVNTILTITLLRALEKGNIITNEI